MDIFSHDHDSVTLNIFIIKSIIIFILALPIGFADAKFEKYRKSQVISIYNRIILVILQLLISSLYIYILGRVFPHITDEFQVTLVGMIFPAVFYSLQSSFFTEIHSIMNNIIN